MSKPKIDFVNWMRNLPDKMVYMPLHQIAIPGSHDSFSYSISRSSDIAPDDPDITFFNKIPCINACAKVIVHRWSVTQSASCTDQLRAGVRYFDLRLAPNPADGQVYLIHGLYGITVKSAMTELHTFLREHPREVIILDFQHFYEFTPETHSGVIADVLATFGPMVCPFTSVLEDVTLSWLWTSGYQVLTFYRDPLAKQIPDLWPGGYLPNPWPNTVDVAKMIEFLDANYARGRLVNRFYVTQGVLTPDSCYVAKYLLSSLKSRLMNVANDALSDWMENKRAGPNGINVVMFDFVNDFPEMIQQIIGMNYVPASAFIMKD